MIRKLITITAIAVVACIFAVPAQAQFGKMGKSLGKAAKSAGKAVSDVAGDMAADMAAQKVAEKAVNFMDNSNTVLGEDSEYVKRLNKLVGKNFTSVGDVTVNYKVYENPEVNILAVADGSIRVYTGLMDFLNDEELVAVISTQIGHIANKDTRDALMKAATGDQAQNAGAAQLEKMLSFSGDKMGSVVNELLQVPYTEEQNKAADTYAYNLLKKSGVSVKGLVTALDKFATIEATIPAEGEEVEETDEENTGAAAFKFIKVNAGNSVRSSFVSSK